MSRTVQAPEKEPEPGPETVGPGARLGGVMDRRPSPSRWLAVARFLAARGGLGTRRAAPLSAPLVVPLVVALGLVGLLVAGCGPSAEREAVDRAAIEEDLREYLPLLARAYRTGNTSILEEHAALKERASIDKRHADLERQGQILAPELDSLTVEGVTVWNRVNAYVTTVEVWDVRVLATGTETVVREELDQANRVRYQLKRDNDRWRVLMRQLEETF